MNEAKLYSVIRAPRVSEKTARLQEVSNQYAFEVAKTATKADIKSAVEQIFSVEVQAVNVVNVKGKNKRSEEHTSELQSLMRISYAVFCYQKKNHKCSTINTTNT